MTKVYMLFYYSYDYYEWETFEQAAHTRERLETIVQAENAEGIGGIPLIDESEHVDYGNKQESHYIIREVGVL